MGRLTRSLLVLITVAALTPVAINEWRRLADTWRRDAQVDGHVAAARRALVDGRPEDALLAMRAARALSPLDVDVQRGLREAEVRVLVDAPERLPVETATAAAHFIQQELPNLPPEETARYLVALGNAADLEHDGDPARWYRRALEADPKLAVAHYHLGRTLLAAGDPEQAEDHLRKAREGRSHDPGVTRALGLVYAARGKWTPAADLLSSLVEHHRDPVVLGALGRAWLEQRKYTVAAEALEGALRGVSDDEACELHVLLARARAHLQQYEAAVESYTRAIELRPSVELRVALGETWAKAGHFGRAEAVFAALLEADLGVGEAHAGLVRARAARGDANGVAAAKSRFRSALPAYPSLRRFVSDVESPGSQPRR